MYTLLFELCGTCSDNGAMKNESRRIDGCNVTCFVVGTRKLLKCDHHNYILIEIK